MQTNRRRMIRHIAWAWAVGWALVSTGMVISDVYSSPNRGLTAYFVLGLAGWAIGATVTIFNVRQQFAVNRVTNAISTGGWAVGTLIAIGLGLFWIYTWKVAYLGPPVAAAIGGAIGGALTLPLRSPTSLATIIGRSVLGAFSWGVTFLVFQVLAFYTGYFLSALLFSRLFPVLGEPWTDVPGWAVPAAICGLLAAKIASMSLAVPENRA